MALVRLRVLLLVALGGVAGGLVGGGSRADAAARPNVLFIAVDDLKPVLGAYGDAVVRSPNIDRLAARGVTFDHAYCNQAVCAPSRNALLTGLRPSTLGIYDLGTNFRAAVPDAVTLPQYFKKHGYRTEAIGKIFHVGHGNHEDPASWTVPHQPFPSIAYVLPENRAQRTREAALFANETDVRQLPRGAPWEAADVPDNAYPDGQIANEAVRRLRAAHEKPEEAFFLAVGFLKPHLPFCAPKKYWDLYDRSSFLIPARQTPPDGAPKYAPTGWGELRQYSDIPEAGPVSDEQARSLIHGYHAAVSFVDAQIGQVLDELDRLNLASNTVVVLWGDHGWHLGDHGWWSKHDDYEQAARLPLIIAAPGVTPPGRHATKAMIETIDLYPTLAELAGLPAPDGSPAPEGRSLVPILRNPDLVLKEFVHHVFPRGERIGQAIRTARYRLVEWKAPGAAPASADLERYDYQEDPLETRNIAAGQPEVVRQLRAHLATLGEPRRQVSVPRRSVERSTESRSGLSQPR